MEGLIIAVFGGLIMFVIGAVFGAVRINQPKSLIYVSMILLGGFIACVVSANIIRIYEDKSPGSLGSYGEILGAVFFCGLLCMPFGIGAVVTGSIRLIAKENAKNPVGQTISGRRAVNKTR